MISRKAVGEYLSIAKSIKGSHLFFDMHTHPFEVIFRANDYHPHPDQNGLYTTGESEFSPPQISELISMANDNVRDVSGIFRRPAVSWKRLSSLYAHTGEVVFEAQMSLSWIDRILLLPVAPPEGSIDDQMPIIERMFQDREKYHFGWSVSNNIKNEDISESAMDAIDRFGIEAIKIHPGQMEIDPTSTSGKLRLEAILDTCNSLRLPLILHSGNSPLTRIPEAATFSTIDTFKDIHWDISAYPVVFAHAASYNCSIEEMKHHILPLLKKLMQQYHNLFIDISGLDISRLTQVFHYVPIERILFGSDSLYEAQWQVVVKLLYSLQQISSSLEEDFLNIISFNPLQYIFRQSTSEPEYLHA